MKLLHSLAIMAYLLKNSYANEEANATEQPAETATSINFLAVSILPLWLMPISATIKTIITFKKLLINIT